MTAEGHNYPAGRRGQFDAEPRRSFTLPSRYYTDDSIAELEHGRIFLKSWTYVGHSSDIPDRGDYFVETVAGQCLFIMRGADGEIRAFYNVCQHRGHELLSGRGCVRQAITCPYHGWTYGLDGALKHARLTEQMTNFDASDYGLCAVRVAVCAGLLFVNLDDESPGFEAEYEGFEDTILSHLPAMASFRAAWHLHYDIAANWKVVVDNFSEGYHIPVAHRKLSQVLSVESPNESIVGARFARFKSRSLGGYEGFELEPGQPYLSWTVWPNLCLLSQPGSENLIVLRMSPSGAGRCAERVDIYAPAGSVSVNLKAVKSLFVDHFNKEDISLVESVQRGLGSLGYDQGRYVAGDVDAWYSESGLHRFHAQLLAALESP